MSARTHEHRSYQLKFPDLKLRHDAVLELGARPAGTSVSQYDWYFEIDGESVRVRQAGSRFYHSIPGRAEVHGTLEHHFKREQLIDEREALRIIGQNDALFEFHKLRDTYVLEIDGNTLFIHFDDVDFGQYVQLEASNPETVQAGMELLGITEAEQTTKGFIEIFEGLGIPEKVKRLYRLRRNIRPYVYGVVSSIGAVSGSLTGQIFRPVEEPMSNELMATTLILVIGTVALFDSQSDGFGMFEDAHSKRGTSFLSASKEGMKTVMVKFLLPWLFAIPFLFSGSEFAQMMFLPISGLLLFGLTYVQTLGRWGQFSLKFAHRCFFLAVLTISVYLLNNPSSLVGIFS